MYIISSRFFSAWKFSIVGQFIVPANDTKDTFSNDNSVAIASSFFIFNGISFFFAFGASIIVIYGGEPVIASRSNSVSGYRKNYMNTSGKRNVYRSKSVHGSFTGYRPCSCSGCTSL